MEDICDLCSCCLSQLAFNIQPQWYLTSLSFVRYINSILCDHAEIKLCTFINKMAGIIKWHCLNVAQMITRNRKMIMINFVTHCNKVQFRLTKYVFRRNTFCDPNRSLYISLLKHGGQIMYNTQWSNTVQDELITVKHQYIRREKLVYIGEVWD